MSWEYISAEEYCVSVRDGTHDTPKQTEFGYKLVTGKHIKNGQIDPAEAYYISERDFNKINERSLVEQWDVLMSMIGTVGEVAVVKDEPSYAIKNVALFKCGGSEIKAKWLFYYLMSAEAQGHMNGNQKGSSQQFLSLKQLRSLPVPVADESYMKRVVDILSVYDNLIENNQKQIKLLEEVAQRLYKEWFVDLRFPGHDNTEIVDGVPAGWRKVELYEVVKLSAGGDRPKKISAHKTQDYTIPVYSNGSENDGLYGYTDKSTINDDCITISARGNVGYACLRRAPFVPIVRLIVAIPPIEYLEYLFFYLKNMQFKSNGAAQQQITVPMIKEEEIILPTLDISTAFKNEVSTIFDLIDNMKIQIEITKEARNRLLPKLMSGELEV